MTKTFQIPPSKGNFRLRQKCWWNVEMMRNAINFKSVLKEIDNFKIFRALLFQNSKFEIV